MELSLCYLRLWKKTNEMSVWRRTSKGDFYLFIVSLWESGLGGVGGPEESPATFHQCDNVNVDGCYYESTV